MTAEEVYFYNRDNLQEVVAKHPEYTKVYFTSSEEDGKVTIGLSKHSGDELYFVSNKEYETPESYLKRDKRTAEKTAPAEKKAGEGTWKMTDSVKKVGQQNLFSFLKKK